MQQTSYLDNDAKSTFVRLKQVRQLRTIRINPYFFLFKNIIDKSNRNGLVGDSVKKLPAKRLYVEIQIPTRIPEKIVVALFYVILVNSGILVVAGRLLT